MPLKLITSFKLPLFGSGASISLAAISISHVHILVGIFSALGSLAVSIVTILWIRKQSRAFDAGQKLSASLSKETKSDAS